MNVINWRKIDEPCPLCGSALLVGPIIKDWYKVYCARVDCVFETIGHVTEERAVEAAREAIKSLDSDFESMGHTTEAYAPEAARAAVESLDDDWKKHDTTDHEAGAAYYDEVATRQAVNLTPHRKEENMSSFEGYPGTGGFYDHAFTVEPADQPEVLETHHLKMARKFMDEYQERINTERRFSDIVDRQVYEDRAYKQAMMHAAIADAEAQTRQAEVAESMLEFVAELVGKTDLVDTLLQLSYRQRAG